MIRKLTKQGNSLALIIERPIRELLEIDANTPLNITVQGRRLIVEPMSDAQRQKKLKNALAETKRQYGAALRALAK